MSEADKTINNARRRLSSEGTPIYRPTKYPFEMICANEEWIIQTECFTDNSLTTDSNLITARFVEDEKTGKTTEDGFRATLFDSCEEAMECIRKHFKFAEGEDGNMYPRVLKVRLSCIVEGIAFESVARDVKGGEKLEGVA